MAMPQIDVGDMSQSSSHLKPYVLMQRDKKIRPSLNGTVVVNPRAESSACNAVRQVLGGKEPIRLINALASKDSCEDGTTRDVQLLLCTSKPAICLAAFPD